MSKVRVKKAKEFWDVRTSKRFKKIGLTMGAVGTLMVGSYSISLPQYVGIAGFVLMVLGAFIANMFTEE